MLKLKKRYVVDDSDQKVAVQIDIATYEKIEEILENYALSHLLEETANEELMSVHEAKTYYNTLEKSS